MDIPEGYVMPVVSAESVRDFFWVTRSEVAPDYCYVNPTGGSSCMYVHGDIRTPFGVITNPDDLVPGCIVGKYLHSIGVPLLAIAQHENATSNTILNHLAGEGWIEIGDPVGGFDPADALRTVQRLQDNSITWHRAIEHTLGIGPATAREDI